MNYTVPVKSNVYSGKRNYSLSRDKSAGEAFTHVVVNGLDLPMRLDLRSHSPTGFNWGYGGSGPAQLALAILAYELDYDNLANTLHQEFKWRVVAKFGDVWELTSEQIREVLKELLVTHTELFVRAENI